MEYNDNYLNNGVNEYSNESSQTARKSNGFYGNMSVSPSAESILNIFAMIILIIGIIFLAIFVVAGLYTADSNPIYGEFQAPLVIGLGVFIFFVFLVNWALIKVMVNISRNLYNIHAELKHKL